MIEKLVSGQSYVFVLKPVSCNVVGILPIEEPAVFLSTVVRKDKELLRLQREDNSTYLLDKQEVKEVKQK